MHRWPCIIGKKAAELGSANAYVCVQLAEEVLQPLGEAVTLRYRMPEEMNAALRGYAERAVALEPLYDEAWEALAQLEAYAENPRPEMVEKIEAAVPTLRHQGKVWLMLAVLHWRLGQPELAEKALATSSQWPKRQNLSAQTSAGPSSLPSLGGEGPMPLKLARPPNSKIKNVVRSSGSVYRLAPELKRALELARTAESAALAAPTLELDDLDVPRKK